MTTSNWVQYEHTRNSRIPEGLAGGTEGKFNEKATQDFVDIDLDDVMLHSEVNLPIDFLVNQTLTLGTEWNQQRMKDLSSNTQALTGTNTGGAIDGVSTTDRSPYSKAEIFSLFAENNMELTDQHHRNAGAAFRFITVLSAITGARR
ncbi:Outer membrane receptor for ferrienterochelin and colicins [Escherichia coli]|nr:Outer membrane receptor for ferrienterochelin and colicins [Escherichia coli]